MTKSEALEIAKQEAQRRDWQWMEPSKVDWGFFSYTVWSHSGFRGGNVVAKVRKRDGTVLSIVLHPK
jgi:hypothetical protein